jgi:hypothetical protein
MIVEGVVGEGMVGVGTVGVGAGGVRDVDGVRGIRFSSGVIVITLVFNALPICCVVCFIIGIIDIFLIVTGLNDFIFCTNDAFLDCDKFIYTINNVIIITINIIIEHIMIIITVIYIYTYIIIYVVLFLMGYNLRWVVLFLMGCIIFDGLYYF